MPRIFFPLDELIGHQVDRARKQWEEQTAQVSSAVSEPLDLDIARKRWDELTTPLFDGIRQGADTIGGATNALNPVQAASGLGRTVTPPADEASKGLMSGARSRWDELTSGIGSEFGSGFQTGERARASDAATPGQRSTLSPDTPAGTLGQAASYLTGNIRDTTDPILSRSQEGATGVTDIARGLGAPEPVARGAGAISGAIGGVQGALGGSALESAARNVGMPEGVVQAHRTVGETMTPTGLVGDVYGKATLARNVTAGLGAAAGAAAGAVLGGETPEERIQGAVRGGLSGLQVGSSVPDLVGGAARLGRGIQSSVRAAGNSADLLGAPLGAVLGATSGPEDQSAGDRLKRAAVGAVLGPGVIRSARGLIDMGRTLDNLAQLRAVSAAGEWTDDLSDAEKIADTVEYKLDRFNEVGRQIEELQNRRSALGELAATKIEQPSYRTGSPFVGARLSEADLYEIAARSEINPNQPGWWQGIDAETVRLYRSEAKVRKAPILTPKQQVSALRREERALAAEHRALEQQLDEHYNRLEQVAPQAVDPPRNPDEGYEQVGAITFRSDKPPTGDQDLRFTDAGWQRVDQPDGSVRYENPRFRRGTDEATSVAEGNPGDTERVRAAVQDIHAVRNDPNLTGPQKNQAIREVFERHPDMTPEERKALRQGVPKQRPGQAPVSTGPTGPATGSTAGRLVGMPPPARPPEPGRVEYPAAAGLNPQSPVPSQPGGVPIPPGTRALGEGNLPTGGESQPPLGDIRQQGVPPIRPGGGDVPPAPEPEGVGVLAPGQPSGTGQVGMAGMPPTREGTIFPERFPPQAAPQPGVGIQSTPRSPIEPQTRVGSVFPENMPEQRPPTDNAEAALARARASIQTGRVTAEGVAADVRQAVAEGRATQEEADWVMGNLGRAEAGRPGIAITTTPRGTDASGVDRPLMPGMEDVRTEGGRVYPEEVAKVAPAPAPTGVGIMSEPRSEIDVPVRQGEIDPAEVARVQPAPPRAEEPVKLTKAGRAARDRMIAERVYGGATAEEAAAGVDEEIRWRRVQGNEGKELRAPDWSDNVGEFMRKWNRLRYIGILSNPVGGIRDALFTAINLPVTNARIAGAAGIERVFRVPANQRSATFSMLRGFDEGQAAGARQAAIEFARVMAEGETRPVSEDLSASAKSQGLTGRNRVDAVLESTYRLRQASDRFYTTMGNRMASTGLAYREAERAGLQSGTPEYKSFVERTARGIQSQMDHLAAEADKAGQRVPQGTVTPRGAQGTDYDALAKEAFQISRRLVYQQDPGTLVGAGAGARLGIMSTIIPLYRTIANMGAVAISHHPLVGTAGAIADVARSGLGRGEGMMAGPYGRANAGGGNLLTRTGSTAVLPLSQRLADSVITGGAVAAAGGALMAGGVITGTGPADASVRRRMQDEGWRPLSIYTGNGYIPLGQVLGPLAFPVAFGATIQEQRMKGGDTDTNVINKFVQTLVESQQSQWFQQSGLRDFYELFNAMGSPDPEERVRSQERIISSVFNQWLAPYAGLGRFANSISDGSVRDPRGLVERWMANYPGLAGNVPERTTEAGQVVARGPGERGIRALSPIPQYQRVESPRKFYGSTGADMDAEITRAISAVNDYNRDETQYRAPTQRQLDLYDEFFGQQDESTRELTRAERVRRRQRTAATDPGIIGSLIGSRSAANFTPPGS